MPVSFDWSAASRRTLNSSSDPTCWLLRPQPHPQQHPAWQRSLVREESNFPTSVALWWIPGERRLCGAQMSSWKLVFNQFLISHSDFSFFNWKHFVSVVQGGSVSALTSICFTRGNKTSSSVTSAGISISTTTGLPDWVLNQKHARPDLEKQVLFPCTPWNDFVFSAAAVTKHDTTAESETRWNGKIQKEQTGPEKLKRFS